MSEKQALFEEIIRATEDAEISNMFGKPCGKIMKKAFVAFFQEEMVFKIGRERIKDLKIKYIGSQNWDPSGKKRAMKDWIQIPWEYKHDWASLSKEAETFTIGS